MEPSKYEKIVPKTSEDHEQEGKEAFNPGEDPRLMCPYVRNRCAQYHWLSGWKKGEKEYKQKLRIKIEGQKDFDPGVDPNDVCPYVEFSLAWGYWMDGWKKSEKYAEAGRTYVKMGIPSPLCEERECPKFNECYRNIDKHTFLFAKVYKPGIMIFDEYGCTNFIKEKADGTGA